MGKERSDWDFPYSDRYQNEAFESILEASMQRSIPKGTLRSNIAARMTGLVALFLVASSIFLSVPARAQGGDGSALVPVILTAAQDQYRLGKDLEMLEDPDGKLTIQDVGAPPYSNQFVLSRVEAPTFGYTSSAYWVRFGLRNENQTTAQWLLEVDFPNMQYADLYLPAPGGGGYLVRRTGVLRPFNSRDIANHHIVFNLQLPPGKDLTLYMRFQNGASMTLPLTLWLPEAYFQEATNELLFLGMFYGVLLIMLAYNLFLLYSLREASYLYYVCFLASAFLFFASYDMLAAQYLWPELPVLNLYSVPFFLILTIASITKFSDSFLDAKSQDPKLHQLTMFVLAGWGILFLLLPFVSYHVIINLVAPYGVLCFGMVAVAGFIFWRRGYLPARYFLFAWAGLLIGGSIGLLVRLSVIPSTFLTEQIVRLGIIWLVAFWAIALADRINLLKGQKETADLEARASNLRYRQLVETMNDGVGVIDEDGRYTYINERMAALLGYPVDEIVGHLMTEFANEENKQILTRQLASRKEGLSTPYELTWRRRDGSDLFALVSPMPLFGDGSQFQGSIAVVTDISDRVQARRLLEQRVAERTHELSTLLELSQEIATTRGLDYLLNRLLERLKQVVDYRHAAILMIQEARWEIGAVWPAGVKKLDLHLSAEEARVPVEAFGPGIPILLDDPGDESQTNSLHPLGDRLSQVFQDYACAWLGIPLLRQGRLIGLLVLGCGGREGFPDDQLRVAVAFANQAAIVIENHQLLDQLQATAVTEERNRLAQDLHDSVTQTLFTASVLAEATPRIWDKDQGIARQNMEKLSTLIRGALAEMRSMLFELRASGLGNQTLAQLLTTLAEAARSRTRADISVSIMDNLALPEKVATAFYRIAREALDNAIDHAEATRIGLSLNEEPGSVELRIRDDGRGFDPDNIPVEHLGVGLMRERAAQVQADLQIQSRAGQGTEIILTWRAEERETGEYG